MSDGGSIVEFFYNLIPGILFVLLLQFFNIIPYMQSQYIEDEILLVVFVYIIIGLFLGFLFQGFTKMAREVSGWNNWTEKRVYQSNKNAGIFIPKKISHHKNNVRELKDMFYLMDNSLRGEHPAFLPTHNSSRFAFWSNIFFAFILLFFIRLIFHPNQTDSYTIMLYGFVLVSFGLADKFFYAYYDSIIKSFYMKRQK